MSAHPSRVLIVAGGYGTRLREALAERDYPEGFPKHLLATGNPDGETLLGRIATQAQEAPVDHRPRIYANPKNAPWFRTDPVVGRAAQIVTGRYDNFLLPILAPITQRSERVLGCAGDFYAEFTWDDMLDAHESSRFPVTFLVGTSVAVDEGLRYRVADTGQIVGMERPERTKPGDLINIGAYIFEPAGSVLRRLQELTASRRLARAETIAEHLIQAGLVGAYEVPNSHSFNVNTIEVYDALLRYTMARRQANSAA